MTSSPQDLKTPEYYRLGMGVDLVDVDFVRGHPGNSFGIRAGHGLSPIRPAHEIDNHKVIPNPSVIIAVHAIEGLDHRTDADIETGFFLDLPARRVLKRFTQFE